MHIPKTFAVDLPPMHQLMRENSFAAMVTVADDSPFAMHVPVIIEPASGGFGSIRSHMARANPQWRQFEDGPEILIIF